MFCCNRRAQRETSSVKVATSEDREKICDEWLKDFEKTHEEKTLNEALTVVINKENASDSIGIDCDRSLKVIRLNDGLIKDWNTQHPDAQVHLGDRVISVNGVAGSTGDMVQEVGRSLSLTLQFHQAPPTPVLPVPVATPQSASSSASSSQMGKSGTAATGTGSSSPAVVPIKESPITNNATEGRAAAQSVPDSQQRYTPVQPESGYRGAPQDDSEDADASTVLNVATDEELAAAHWRHHPEEDNVQVLEIHLMKSDEVKSLGVDARKERGVALRVSNLTEGLIPCWNDLHPDAQIKVGDCIVGVNGISGDPQRMVQAIGQNKNLRLLLHRQAGSEEDPDQL